MTNCPLCSSKDTQPHILELSSVYATRTYDLYKCHSCKNIFTYPQPTLSTLSDIYKHSYAYKIHLQILSEKKFRAKYLADIILKSGRYHKILEIGCMYGYLLEELADNGLEVHGAEIDKKATKYCQSQGLDVINCSLSDYPKISKSKYDLIILSHSLEHLPNPKTDIAILKKLLSPQGKLLILVPNSESFCARLFGRYWGYWQVPIHLNHFNQKSLSNFLKSQGFSPTTTAKYGGDSLMFLSTLANLLKVKKTENDLSGRAMLIKIFSFFIKYWIFLGNDDLLIISQYDEK